MAPDDREVALARKLLTALLVLAFATGCSGGDDSSSLDGRWDGGEDWGEVIIDGLTGTYSSTFGPDLGVIELTEVGEGVYEGTWGEGGTSRFGTIQLTQESGDVVTGEWTADPDSEIPGSSGGLIRWER